ncbi:hypothetical protein A2662_02530 [Candidatus Giovannonibacteria bacterium RIFCSPHIGHO2_01_FULL_45_33]|uniref:CDP-glycerol--glycerophosphate glycerophosphotransferase n=1 Tax=Candidatus Giovannonibacteria bacterium RIFCSPLOWO2_01_FULL_45_34 TaxID=1798351 RepID=A0A1F5WYD9_9BACT|nr:MAG: hypothetical protein A2662_02530 [Candidatus Giovannonibacteria bacterium RIFCSPHIGHO2_01_FULL_45_33]OGF70956.1 MAG: hypothetical protein A3C73_03990 [Candidatus Giovannonibacteria bacterium RIFCSPHIGHO2_02_FULL_44_11]OGF80675.1 MAG: hypothetical protein A2930_01755 [Candidatus Giovannonibacteria bacterium RIFCSPLOWO2_01_FULL_45_34]
MPRKLIYLYKVFLRFLFDVPLYIRALLLIRNARHKNNMSVLAEIATTNEFFYLLPVLKKLCEDNAAIIFFCRAGLRGALSELRDSFFVSTPPFILDISWIRKFPEVDFYLNATLSYDIVVPARAKYKINFPHTTTAKNKDIFSPAIGKISDSFNSGPAYETDLLNYCKENNIKQIPRMHAVGVPRTDALFDHTIDRERFLSGVGLDPNKRTVMYAPTWNQDASLMSWIEHILEIPEKHNVNLIVKIHPGMYINPKNKKSSGGVDWKTFFAQERLMKKGIINVYNEDSVDYVMASDIGITDMSTIWTEFFILHKHMVFIHMEEFFKNHGLSSLGDFRERCGYMVSDIGALDKVLDDIFSGNLPVKTDQALEKLISYNAGGATKATVDKLKELYEAK